MSGSFTPSGVEFVAKGLNSYLGDLSKADKAQQDLGKSVSSIGSHFATAKGGVASFSQTVGSSSSTLGSFVSSLGSMATVAGGIVAAQIFNSIASGIKSFAAAGLEAVSHAQTLEASLGALLTQNNLYARTTETMSVAVGGWAEAQADAAKKSDDLAFKQRELTAEINTQNASIQEQRQRIMQMADGLDKNQQVARLQEMEIALEGMTRELGEAGTEQGKLKNVTQEYTTVTKTAWEQVMNMGDAQKLAKQQTQELLGFIEKLAIVSPFEQEDVEKVTQYAIGAGLGVQTTKDFTEGFLDLAAAVGITSPNLDEAAYQLLQVKKAGILTAVDLRQLSTRGIDLAKIIGVQMSMSVDEFNAKAKTTPAIFDQLIQAVTDYSKNTFAGTSQAMSQSLEGFRSTLSDLFTQSAKKIFRPLVDAATPAISKMVGNMAGFITGGGVEKIGEGLAKAIFGAFESFSGGGEGQLFSGLKALGLDSSTAKSITEITQSVSDLFAAFNQGGVGGLAVALGIPQETVDAITTVNTQIAGLMASFQTGGFAGLAESLGIPPEVVAGITSAADEFQRLMSVFSGGAEEGGASGGFSAIFEDLKAQITEALPQLAADIMTGIPVALTAVTDAIGEHFRTNVPAFQEILAEWGPKFWEWVNTIIDGAGVALAGIILAITEWATSPEAQTSLNTTGSEIGKSIVTGIGLLFENAGELGTVLLKLSAGLLAAAAVLTGDLIIIGGQIVAGIISGILESLGVDLQPATFDKLSTILSNIGKDGAIIAEHAATAIAKGFEKLGDAILNALVPGLANLKSKLKPYFEDTFKETKDLFSGEKWMELGTSAIEGLLEGMKERAGDVLEFIKQLAADSLSGLGQFWGSDSPATEFMPLGASVPQGLAVGINNASGVATQAIENMGRGLLTSTSSALSFIDDLNMGGLARGFGTGGGQWRNFRNILKNEIMAGMGGLADGSINIMDKIQDVAARFNFPPQMAAEFAQMNGLVEHLTGSFSAFQEAMNLENIGNMLGIGGSFSAIGGTLAGMLEEQIGNSKAAKTEVEKLVQSNIKLDKSNLDITDSLSDQQQKMAILLAELSNLSTQEEIDTLAIDKKKIAIDELTEAMEKNRQKLLDNQAALKANSLGMATLATTGPAGKLEALGAFLEGTDEWFHMRKELDWGGFSDFFIDRNNAQLQYNELLAEQKRQEALITQQKEAQQKLDKLKVQLDLINLGRQLGGDIFAGITFGLDASVEDLLAATNAVTMAMVDQINQDLQIASPSKVMARIGERITQGLAIGVDRGGRLLEYAVNASVSPFLDMGRRVAAPLASTYNNSTNNNFDMKVMYTGDPAAVIRQYEVARSMV